MVISCSPSVIPLTLLCVQRLLEGTHTQRMRGTKSLYLMVLSEVSSTMWGSRVSQGYQAACFRVRDVELVKNRSATGMVLEQSGDDRCDRTDGAASEGTGRGRESGARLPPAVHHGLPALELGVFAPAFGQLHGREPFGADQRHMVPRGAEQRLIHLEQRRIDAQQRLPRQAGRGPGLRSPSVPRSPAEPRTAYLVTAQLRLGAAQTAEVDVEQRAALAVP